MSHHYLAVFLALATIATVFVISSCYSHIIEEFPSGGGGYLVASKLLGRRIGVISGCALLVDYVLTITTSIAAAGARYSALSAMISRMLGLTHHETMMFVEVGHDPIADRAQSPRRQRIGHDAAADLFDLPDHAHLIIGGAIGLHLANVGGVATDIGTKCARAPHNPWIGVLGMLGLLLLRLFDGRRHVYRHRSRVEQHARDARAARANRQAHDALHGRFRWRSPPAD